MADPITIRVDSMTVNARFFIAGPTTTGAMNKETTVYHDISGSAFAVSLIRAGVPDGDGTDFWWAALVNNTPFSDEIRVSFTATVTVGGSSAPVTFGGTMAYSDKGLYWKLPPPKFTVVATDGNLIGLSFITNRPGLDRGATQLATIDLQIKGQVIVTALPPAEVPEPATLVLMGLGMTLIGRRMGKPKI